MDLKRIKEINLGLSEAMAYWATNFKPGILDHTWEAKGSNGETYLINYYDIDDSYDCSCICFKNRGECKHGLLVKVMVRRKLAMDANDRELRPLTLNDGHMEVLRWFSEHGATDQGTAVTSRQLCNDMQRNGDHHVDQHYFARICELNKHCYLNPVEGYEGERLPPDTHYFLNLKGRRTLMAGATA